MFGMIVEIRIYSGVSNPNFVLTETETREVIRRLELCTTISTEKPRGGLGYSGFNVTAGNEILRIGQGVISSYVTTRSVQDTAEVENYLLEVARRQPELAGHPWIPLVAGGPLREPLLLDKIRTYFSTYEGLGVKVGRVWLNADQVTELRKSKDFEQELNPTLHVHSALLVGYLWGACVYQSNIVPVNHAAFLQDDIDGALIGTAACMPL